MGWQLIYTSSPRCLKAGHSGFGTVARHRELRARLVEILERFSSYERPSFDPTPRIDSHRIIDLSDERYHVVTRIRDAGTDYSGRTNHIAHHVIFSADEVAAADATPIDFLISWNGWRTAWTEPARFLDDQAPVALGDIPHSFPPPSRAWAKLTGDPGSAACLSPHRETLIIAKPGCEDALLPLMGESLALIDHESWAIPFTTFLKSNDNPDDFLWRACPRGAAAESAARRRGATIIDPGDPPSLPRPDPDLVDRARWGRPTATRPATPRVPAPERPDLPGASAARPGHATPRRPIPALLPEPDFADADEIFKAWRAWRFELRFTPLIEKYGDLIKETIHWNAEQGAKLTGPQLSRIEKKRTELYHRLRVFMEDHEFLIAPVSQVPPFDVSKPYITQINGKEMPTYIDWMQSCYFITVTGHPAISVPCGFTPEGLPVGVQIVGRHQDDFGVLQLAYAFQQATQTWRKLPQVAER